MIVTAHVEIKGSVTTVWAAITNIEGASEIISGIENIEIVEKPANGLVGLRWRETRILFGKPATVEKWVTDAVENELYKTKATEGGFEFLTAKRNSARSGGITLTESRESMPQGIVATLQSIPMRLLFRGVIRKALLQDLNDIKAAVPIAIAGTPTVEQYWEDGPQFTGWGEVVGKYPDGTPAIVQGECGNGWVLLCGVHPEAPDAWRRASRLAPQRVSPTPTPRR